jgi:hypothetical protein
VSLPPHPHTVEQRALADEKTVREGAHKSLDEALDMYFEGAPLEIRARYGWITMRVDDELHIVIAPKYS